jgi:predicted ATPase with chaperone activity
VHENQQITENTVVAIIENTGDYEDVKMLKAILDTIDNVEDFNDSLSNYLKLGEIQNAFSNFQRNVKNKFVSYKKHL